MRTTKSLKKFAVILLILTIATNIFAVLEIFNTWAKSTFEIVGYQMTNSLKFTLSDKIVFTVYQLLNISLILPVYWFYEASKSIAKGIFFESFIIKKFNQIGNFLYIVSAIAVIFPRFFTHDESIRESLWYGIHPIFVMIFATLMLSFAVIFKEAKKQKEENELTI